MAHDDHPHDHAHHHHHHESPAHEHREAAPTQVSVFIVTCSDTRDAAHDEGGALARKLVEHAGHSVAGTALVPDDAAAIDRALDQALEAGARAVLFTGGTGFSRRDVTVETLSARFERRIDGFGELFRSLSYEQVGSAAMLSRACAGVVRGAAVFALPGSPHAVKLALEALVLPELGHLARELAR
jgi:molybdenum cofactor biosynthesis protein B